VGVSTVFVSYSHQQADIKERLVIHLRAAGIEVWDDSQIPTGGNWRDYIQQVIDGVLAAVFLISDDFLTSKFIVAEEVPRLLGRVRVFPVIAQSCPWKEVDWLEKLELWNHGKPLSDGSERECELAALAEEIAREVKKTIVARALEPREGPSCQVDADPERVRAEGLSERVADLRLTFRGSSPGSEPLPSRLHIAVTMNVNITNAKIDNMYTDAVLDSPQSGKSVFGRVENINSLIFDDVSVDVPGPGATQILRIRNIRANVSQLGIPGPSGRFEPHVLAYIQVRPSEPRGEPIVSTDRVVVVGIPQLGAGTRFRGPNETDVPLLALFPEQSDRNEALACDAENGRGEVNITIRLKEGFPGAFRTASEEQGATLSPSITSGTRFFLRFYNVPHGVQLFVTTVDLQSGLSGRVFNSNVRLVAGATPNGSGGTLFEPGLSLPLRLTTDGAPIIPVAITGGFGFAVWEWAGTRCRQPGVAQEVTFGLVFAVQPGDQPRGTIQVSACLVPIDSRVTAQPIGEPIPRFVDCGANRSVFTFLGP
jgi:hypothetical protein